MPKEILSFSHSYKPMYGGDSKIIVVESDYLKLKIFN